MLKKQLLIVLLLILAYNRIFSQNSNTSDSLRILFQTARHDTLKVKWLMEWGMSLLSEKPDSTLVLLKKANLISQEKIKKLSKSQPEFKFYKSCLASSFALLGYYYNIFDEYKEALNYYFQAVKVFDELGDKKELGSILSNVALIYKNTGDKRNSISYNEKSLKLREEIKDSSGISTTLNNLAAVYDMSGEISKALEYYNKCLVICEKIKDKEGIATAYTNMGQIFERLGDISKALQYQTKSLKIYEEIGDKEGIATSLNNIGIIYKAQGDFQKSIDFFSRGLKIRTSVGNKQGCAFSLNNIGSVYRDLKDFNKAMDFFKRAYELRLEIGDKLGIGNSLNNIGTIYEKKEELQLAQDFYERSLKIQLEVGDKLGTAFSYYNISSIFQKKKNYKEALNYAEKSIEISKNLGYPQIIRNAAERLSALYKDRGDYKKSLENYELFITMRDSINNIETQKATIKQLSKFEYDKQRALADKENEFKIQQQKKISASEKQKQTIIIISVSMVLVLVAIFSIFLFNRFRLTQKQKTIIELKEKETYQQKILIEEKHKEITDSINYAERIQRSFLATEQHLAESLNEYFILFKPKDVVSGDFYWSATLENGCFAFVTADSTGHGVPGAIMSLLNITSLEKAVETHTQSSEILNETRQIIIERLKKDGSIEGGKDGMDCSLCIYDFKNMILQISAAHNPVWIVREEKVIEIKGDKMPVGKHDHQDVSFSLQEIKLQKGDLIYTLTDGFPDQFGGEKGKKFMSKNLRELLLKNASLPLNLQKEILENTFANWLGQLEQVDDLCVVGIKI